MVPPLGPLIGDHDELYLTFAECPHDELPAGYHDGDNSLLEGKHLRADEDFEATLSADVGVLFGGPKMPEWMAKQGRRVVVPHPRDLRRGDSGVDVLALQRALAAVRLREWGKFTRTDGAGTVAEVKKFQAAHHLKVDGVYGEATHRALASHYDSYGIFLLNEYQANNAVAMAQRAMLSAAQIAYNYRWTIHYTQGGLRWSMISQHVRAQAIPMWRSLWADCSSWFTWAYWTIGAPDPNLLGFTGGFTGTLGERGKHIDVAHAKVGAGFLYGSPPWKHIQLSVGGANSVGCGSEAGPLYLSAYYRSDLNAARAYPGLI
jgi:hypothetical protein